MYWFSDRSCCCLEEIRAYFEHAWDVIRDEVYRAEDVVWIATDVHSAVCIYTYHYEDIFRGIHDRERESNERIRSRCRRSMEIKA